MSLDIISADQRINSATVKGLILGPAGVGKTTLVKTTHHPTTLFVSCERGELSIDRDDEFGPRFSGDTMRPSNWGELEMLLSLFERPDRPEALRKYRTVFVDSLSVAADWCFDWCQTQPDAFSERLTNPDGSPKADTRGAYGLLARTMPEWLWRWKRIDDINVWAVGGMFQNKEYKWEALVPGKATAASIPFIMDFTLVLNRFSLPDGRILTGLHTDPKGEYGSIPVKTRGGGFDAIEPPHLGQFMAKALGRSSVIAPPPSAPSNDLGSGTTSTETAKAA
jgi:hypothetical protein